MAFATGDLLDQTVDQLTDILQLSRTDLAQVQHWSEFYKKTYPFVGYLAGRFYDASGRSTEYLDRVHRALDEHRAEQADRARWLEDMPPCNVEWKPELGTRVWCSAHSGGVRRDWRGVPRKFYEPGQSTWRCACVRSAETQPNYVEQYAGCEPTASSCIAEAPKAEADGGDGEERHETDEAIDVK